MSRKDAPGASTAPELAALYLKRPQLIKPGLDRIELALRHLPELQAYLLATPTVLIGGTNGKGTTSGYLFQILAALGLKVGLFTSPHLIEFRERIRCSHLDVTDDLLKVELEKLQKVLPATVYEPLSFFEINTLLAVALYREVGVNVCILEVGLGGRWDSTNVASPQVSVITSIGLDHQEFLGHTYRQIAREKAGIMRPGRVTLWSGENGGPRAASEAIQEVAIAVGATLLIEGEAFKANSQNQLTLIGTGWDMALLKGPIAVAKRWQSLPSYLWRNATMALTAAAALLADPRLVAMRSKGPSLDDFVLVALAIDRGIVPVPPSLFARFQILDVQSPSLGQESATKERLLLDVCHNPDGARAFAAAVRQAGWAPCPALVSILGDKDVNGILDELTLALGPLVLFSGRSDRAWRREQLSQRHQHWPWAESLEQAWEMRPNAPGAPLAICGSVVIVGEALEFFSVPVLA